MLNPNHWTEVLLEDVLMSKRLLPFKPLWGVKTEDKEFLFSIKFSPEQVWGWSEFGESVWVCCYCSTVNNRQTASNEKH